MTARGVAYALIDEKAWVVKEWEADFSTGTFSTIQNVDGRLLLTADAVTQGTWTSDYIDIDSGIIDGSKIEWQASSGAIVEYSLNDGAWTAATNRATVFPAGTDTANDLLKIRVRLPVSADPDTIPNVSNIRFVTYADKDISGDVYGLDIDVVDSVALGRNENVLTPNAETGAKATGGYFIIPAQPQPVKALSFWIKPTTLTNYIMDARTATATTANYMWINAGSVQTGPAGVTFYINGVAKTPVLADFPVNEWTFVTVVWTTNAPGEIYLLSRYTNVETMAATLAAVEVYYSAPSATEIKNRYNSDIGVPVYRVGDPGLHVVGEKGYLAYGYSWSVTSSG